MSLYKKINFAIYGSPKENRQHYKIMIDLTPADKFLAKYNKENPDNKITYSYIALKAMGDGMMAGENINGKLSFGNLIPVDSVDLGLLVNIKGKNLFPLSIKGCNKFGIKKLANQSKRHVKDMQNDKSEEVKRVKTKFGAVPTSIVDILIKFSTFLNYNLDLAFEREKLRKNHYGFGVISNLGNFGIYDVMPTSADITKSNICLILCSPKKRPFVAENGEIEIRNSFIWSMNLDNRIHNLLDSKELCHKIKDVWANPEKYL